MDANTRLAGDCGRVRGERRGRPGVESEQSEEQDRRHEEARAEGQGAACVCRRCAARKRQRGEDARWLLLFSSPPNISLTRYNRVGAALCSLAPLFRRPAPPLVLVTGTRSIPLSRGGGVDSAPTTLHRRPRRRRRVSRVSSTITFETRDR